VTDDSHEEVVKLDKSPEKCLNAEEQKAKDEKKSLQKKTLKGYKMQCNLVEDTLIQLIDIYVSQGNSIVIEGVHILSKTY